MTQQRFVHTVILFIIVWAFFFFPVLVGKRVFFSHDIMSFYYPYRAYAAARLLDGDIPLWSSLTSCGLPVHAIGEIGILYPLNLLLYRLFEPLRAFSLGLVGHYLLAGLGIIVLQYLRRRHQLETLLSAIIFTFSGFMVTHLIHTSIINAAAWLPWLFVCLYRWKHFRKWQWVVLAAGVSALQFLAAHPQIGVMSLVAACLWLIFNSERAVTRTRTLCRCLLACILLVLITYSVASVQLLPLFETVVHSTRGHGPASVLRSQGSLPPIMVLNLLFPDFFGRVRPGDVSGYGFVSPYSWGPGSAYWEMCGYVGSLTLLLVALGMISYHQERDNVFYIILALLGLVLALGNVGLLYHVLQFFPGAERLRFPSRFLMLWSFAAALLAGDGLRSIQEFRTSSPARKLTIRIAVFVCAISLVMAPIINTFVARYRGPIEEFGRQWIQTTYMQKPGHRLTPERYQQKLVQTIRGLLHSTDLRTNVIIKPLGFLALGILFIMLLQWRIDNQRRRVMITIVLFGLVVIDLFTFSSDYNTTTTPAVVTESETARVLLSDTELFRFLSIDRRSQRERELLKPAFNVLFGIPSLFTPGPFMTRGLHDWFTVTGTGLMPFDSRVRKRMISENLPLIGLMNVKYILTEGIIEDERLYLVHDGNVRIYCNRMIAPRVHLVEHALDVPAGRRGNIPAFLAECCPHPRKVIALERTESHEVERVRARALNSEILDESAPGIILSMRYAEHHIDIDVDIARSCWLRLTDAWYPGWQARIDGQLSTILVADGLFRALELTPGNHSITFDYRPWSFMAGLFGSLLALACIAGAMIARGWKC